MAKEERLIAAKQVNPDLAIVFEGCPADDTAETPEMIQSAMGKGPMLRYFDVSMITNPEFQEYALEIAKIHKIPVQVSVRSGGGTNGMAITQVQGAPDDCCRNSCPLRSHTPLLCRFSRLPSGERISHSINQKFRC